MQAALQEEGINLRESSCFFKVRKREEILEEACVTIQACNNRVSNFEFPSVIHVQEIHS